MSIFTGAELRYLHGGRRLARLATVDKDGLPRIVPVGWRHNREQDTIDIGGHELERTAKYRDVIRTGRAAVVIDDLASVTPWRPRAVMVRGRAEAFDLPAPMIRIHPEHIASWGLDEERSSRRVSQDT